MDQYFMGYIWKQQLTQNKAAHADLSCGFRSDETKMHEYLS